MRAREHSPEEGAIFLIEQRIAHEGCQELLSGHGRPICCHLASCLSFDWSIVTTLAEQLGSNA